MNGVDYFSANHCLIESRMSTPDESGLGWTVNLDREPFIGQDALRQEKERGPDRKFAGLELDWDEYELLHAKHNIPPEVSSAAWRSAVPVYTARGEHIGQATSGAWSPAVKKNLALATIHAPYAKLGTVVRMEVTVEYVRSNNLTLIATGSDTGVKRITVIARRNGRQVASLQAFRTGTKDRAIKPLGEPAQVTE